MSAETVAQPYLRVRTRSLMLGFVGLAVVVLALSAGVAAVVSDGSSGTSATAAGAPSDLAAGSCPGDAGKLLTVVAAMPVTERAGVLGSLSRETRLMLRVAAVSSAYANAVDPMPDASAIAGVLNRIPPRDSAVLLNALAPQTRAAVQAASARVCG